jgi:hypothetical protein
MYYSGGPMPPGEERPLLVTAAGIVGVLLGGLALLRGAALFLTFLAEGLDIPARDFGLLLLMPAGGVVLVGGIDALRRGAMGLLLGGAWALLGVDVLNGTTYGLAYDALPAIDVLSGVMTFLLLVVLLHPQVRRWAVGHR